MNIYVLLLTSLLFLYISSGLAREHFLFIFRAIQIGIGNFVLHRVELFYKNLCVTSENTKRELEDINISEEVKIVLEIISIYFFDKFHSQINKNFKNYLKNAKRLNNIEFARKVERTQKVLENIYDKLMYKSDSFYYPIIVDFFMAAQNAHDTKVYLSNFPLTPNDREELLARLGRFRKYVEI